MKPASPIRESIRKAARLFRVGKVAPSNILSMAIRAMEDAKMQLAKGQSMVVPDEYCISLAGDAYDEFAGIVDTLEVQVADQLRAYAMDAGFRINKNRVSVHIARMPSSRRGTARAEALFSGDTDLNRYQTTDPLDEVRIRFEGDDRTMVFGRLSRQESWKDNYGLKKESDFTDLSEAVRMMDAGLTEDASALVEGILENNPSHNGLWVLIDCIRKNRGDGTSTERLRSRALLVKNDPLLSAAVALMLLEDGQPEAAMWEVLEEMNRQPEHPLLLLILAQAYREMDLDALAGKILELVNPQDADDPLVADQMRRFRTRRPKTPPPAERPTRFYRLLRIDPKRPDRTDPAVLLETRKAKLVIGRAGGGAQPDLVLDDDMVSSSHCQIINNGGIFYIVDSNSRNGVWVNDRRVETMQLKTGDLIRLGATHLRFDSPARSGEES